MNSIKRRFTFCLCGLSLLIAGQMPIGAHEIVFEEHISRNYRVLSQQGVEHAVDIAERMEQLLELYNRYFHFDTRQLDDNKLTVRFFEVKQDYNDYLQEAIEQSRNDYTYIHYGDAARNELVAYSKENIDAPLAHHGFIQFLRAFITNPPLWLREGFAIYFENVEYDSNFEIYTFRENLIWLDALKSIMSGQDGLEPIMLDVLMEINAERARDMIDIFYPEAWGFVSFLANSEDRQVNRILWDTISTLEPDATIERNSHLLRTEAFEWFSPNTLSSMFREYVLDRKSYRSYVEEGVARYLVEDPDAAQIEFFGALNIREDNFVPYYYLGLISYDNGNYTLADFYYREALRLQTEESHQALTYYALGVTAFADGRYDDMRDLFTLAVRLDHTFTDRTRELLEQIPRGR